MKKLYVKPESKGYNVEIQDIICMSKETANSASSSISSATEAGNDEELAGGYRSGLWQ